MFLEVNKVGTLVRLATFLAPVVMNLLGFWAITEEILMKVTGVTFLGRPTPEGPFPSILGHLGTFAVLLSYYFFWVVGRRRGN